MKLDTLTSPSPRDDDDNVSVMSIGRGSELEGANMGNPPQEDGEATVTGLMFSQICDMADMTVTMPLLSSQAFSEIETNLQAQLLQAKKELDKLDRGEDVDPIDGEPLVIYEEIFTNLNPNIDPTDLWLVSGAMAELSRELDTDQRMRRNMPSGLQFGLRVEDVTEGPTPDSHSDPDTVGDV